MAGALTPDELIELSTLAPDLRFILSERETPDALQLMLLRAGYRTMGLFVSMVDSKTLLRAALKADFGLDDTVAALAPDVAKERRMNVARLIDSWKACERRVEEVDRAQATQIANRLPQTVPKSTLISLRSRYESDFGRVPDIYWPNTCLIEQRLEEVEEGEVKADILSSVSSMEECVEEIVAAVLSADGAYRTKKVPKLIPLPTNAEDLRIRLRMLGITFQLAHYKHSSRLWLVGCTPRVWLDHTEFILGDDCARLSHRVLDVTITPPWNVILTYEHQIRKLACRMIMFENATLENALVAARNDVSCKEKYFSTPTAMAAAVGSRSAARLHVEHPPSAPGTKRGADDLVNGLTLAERQLANKARKAAKGKAKGTGTKVEVKPEKSKGSGKGFLKAIHAKAPDGRNICHRYQVGKCSQPSCSFVHVCSQCLGAHAGQECPTLTK